MYERGHASSDWLCQHKGVTPEIAKHIHDFVSWKPCPVFFFEPGDVLLQMHWSDSEDGGDLYSKFVARNVKD